MRKIVDNRIANINKILFEKFLLTKRQSWKKVRLEIFVNELKIAPIQHLNIQKIKQNTHV